MAMNGRESPGQWNAQAVAPSAAATRPAPAPARLKSVGAAFRSAQTNAANGAIANSGMQMRHVSHSGPKTMLWRAIGVASRIAPRPREAITRNGKIVNANRLRVSTRAACGHKEQAADAGQAHREEELDRQQHRTCALEQVRPETDRNQHQAEGSPAADHERQSERPANRSAPHGLDIRAQQIDELACLHVGLPLLIGSPSAFMPRCTDTLMADSDMPDRAAASLTLSPSSFTY